MSESNAEKIGVTALSPGMGATMTAHMLAFYYRDKGLSVSYTEIDHPRRLTGRIYDAVAMRKRFFGRRFIDMYDEIINKKPIKGRENKEAGIDWGLITHYREKSLLIGDAGILADRSQRQVNIMDLGPVCTDLAALADRLIVIIDPLPSRMLGAYKKLTELKDFADRKKDGRLCTKCVNDLSGVALKDMMWIVNGVTDAVSKRQVKKYLGVENISWIPKLPQREIYSDEYRCRFHAENPALYDVFKSLFDSAGM